MTTRIVWNLVLLPSLWACAAEEPDVGEADALEVVTEPQAIATDSCDEPTYAGATWSSASSPHLVAYYLPGTAAERDMVDILARREIAYAAIRTRLGVTSEPVLSVHLSPSRLAAQTLGRKYGQAWPGEDRYEVIYTGAPDSYEVVRLGHEMTHLLEYYIDPVNPRRIPILTEGLAEYLDQSGRDMHESYAQQLLAGSETRVRIASFESNDVTGRNYGRAGSLVQFLVDRYGMAAFLEIFKATKVTWTRQCWTSAVYGCIDTPEALTVMLDGAIAGVTGESWSQAEPSWEADVQAALATAKVSMPLADRDAIRNLLAVMDQAVAAGDPAIYRSTMEGFYCEWGGEPVRTAIAGRAVAAFGGTSTTLMRVYPTGIKNFTSARAMVRRSDERGLVSVLNLTLERFPEGWRVTYGPDWW